MREKEVMNRITASWNPEAPFFVRLVIMQLYLLRMNLHLHMSLYMYLYPHLYLNTGPHL